ncbi:MAG: 23S rRNA (guanosine(2251)-2'-O)-methyltransferase RlmB [bacterium]|nr:23S rRNA (guanosine(2251)-2'-O)-methyltransferase RlmB [bacterium]
MKKNIISVYGIHVVNEALANRPDVVRAVYLAVGEERAVLATLAKKKGIAVTVFDRAPALGAGVVHQGSIADIDVDALMLPYDVFEKKLQPTSATSLVVLDEIEDPQNVGSIIRSAAAFGIGGVLIPGHNQAQITGAVIKVSAGMAFRVPLVSIGNVNNTLHKLKENSFWIYSLEAEGDSSYATQTYDTPVVFVLGNEGKGVRLKTREFSDFNISIPIHPQCESLNVGTAGAVVLSVWGAQHPEALK